MRGPIRGAVTIGTGRVLRARSVLPSPCHPVIPVIPSSEGTPSSGGAYYTAMGRLDIPDRSSGEQLRDFARHLLDDVEALDRICRAGLIESDVRRIGAEQEMFLVDGTGRPAMIGMEVLDTLTDGGFTTELGRFNLEYNLPAQELGGSCFQDMEHRLMAALDSVRRAARPLGGDVLLVGILPTLEKTDLTLDNMSPLPRYYRLNAVMSEQGGGTFRTAIEGLDELHVTHDNVMLEACNASFQVHFQVSADEFPLLYNLAQVVTAPLLAAAVNSPLLLRQRLWRETRIALFEQSLDMRSEALRARDVRRRVWFGDRWVRDSVVDLFREDIARYRVLMTIEPEEVSTAVLARGDVPPLTALTLHNGTVYRWNRPCYGITDGKPHLRIENRVLPSGPTVVDEVANMAFYVGLMTQLSHTTPDVRTMFSFDDVRANFVATARYGLGATVRWAGGRRVPVRELIFDELLPAARDGLRRRAIDDACIARYLGVIEDRVRSGRTGAAWMLDALEHLRGMPSRRARIQALTEVMRERQQSGAPVHTWDLPPEPRSHTWRGSYRTVGQVMTTDLFTVHPEDLVDVAAAVMDWEHIRHVPVEDREGRLVGLVSHRTLLRLMAQGQGGGRPRAVREVMKPDPVTITPDAPCLDAIARMREHRVACLPVVQESRLVGIVTERDFLEIAGRLLEEHLRADELP